MHFLNIEVMFSPNMVFLGGGSKRIVHVYIGILTEAQIK